MNGGGKSDGPIVPKKPANNGGSDRLDGCHPATPSAERAEGRGPAKGNSLRGPEDRAQDRATSQAALERIRRAASRDKAHPYPNERLAVTTQGRSPVR
jgi:hypothetical protein